MLAFKVFAVLAGLIHFRIFVMESIQWGKPKVNQIFGVTPVQAETCRLLAWNQGVYNLLLGLGALTALLPGPRLESVAIYSCLFMVGAAIALYYSAPRMLRGVFIQGGPPFVALAAMLGTSL